MKEGIGKRAGAGLALLAVILVFLIYYVLHKPFGPAFAAAAARAAQSVMLTGAIVTACGGFGRWLLGKDGGTSLAGLAMQAALGLGVASLMMLLLGAVGLFEAWAGLLLLAVLLVAFRGESWAWLKGWRGIRETLDGRLSRALAALTLSILLLALAEALAPPVHFDALVYHLALPQTFVRQGGLVFVPESPYWGFPLSTELLYTWGMILGGEQAAAVLGWSMGLLALLGTLGFALAYGTTAAWIAVAVLLSGKTLASSPGWAYSDWMAALQGVALLIALSRWRAEGGWRSTAIAGFMAGLAIGVKYTAGVVLVAGMAALLLDARGLKRWRETFIFLAAAALAVAPWLVKNAIGAGAVLYPMTGQTAWISPESRAFFRGEASATPLLDSLLIPLAATLKGIEGGPGFSASLGPWMVGLLVGWFYLSRARRKETLWLARFVLAGWLVWAVASRLSPLLVQSRLYFALFPAWAALAALGFEGFNRLRLGRIRLGRLIAALVAFSLTLTTISVALDAIGGRTIAGALRLIPASEYRLTRLGAYEIAMAQVRDLPEGSRVLNLWEPRGYYCQPVCIPDYWIDRWYASRRRLGEPARILDSWKELGITHVLLNAAGERFVQQDDARFTESDWAALSHLEASLEPIASVGDAYVLFRVP